MKSKSLAFIAFFALVLVVQTYAQVGVGTSSPMASLDISVKDAANPEPNEGVLVPRVTNFPVVNPAAAQHGMLLYMNNPAAYAGTGFYYWDTNKTAWLPLVEVKWITGTNAGSDDLIYAKNANDNGNKIVVQDDGFVGMGTDSPASELHIVGSRNTGGIDAELSIANPNNAAELQLSPGVVGSSDYTIVANADDRGLTIDEDGVEKIQIKEGGDLRIDELETGKNSGIVYPASVYAEADGTIKVKTAYSRLDDLKVNLNNFATVDYAEQILPFLSDESASLYTYTVTPTQDVLLEVSYQVSVKYTAYGSAVDKIEKQHNTKMSGTIVKLDGLPYTYKTTPVISNDGLDGSFISSDHLYIPLVADGSTYSISIHGYVQNDKETSSGIRGTFGGNPRDQLQIIEHK